MEQTGPYFLCTGEIDDGVTMAGGTTTRHRSSGDSANNDNMMHHHILEIFPDDISLLVRGIDEMITEGRRNLAVNLSFWLRLA
jgi:hypothetical protein